jgi:O-antigen chain-terminating methyltransferase
MVHRTNADFYLAFENRFRGTRDQIKSRLRVYLPFLEPFRGFCGADKAVDLGCGRGEWLELLQESGFDAQGVDLDDGMLAACRERGFKAQTGDAVTFLKGLPEASQAVVSGFHLAEHIPFADLQSLVAEALRVLIPGGLLILETPNPENIVVGTSNFYVDPTHQRPIPSVLLSFLPEYYGFEKVKTLRLQERIELSDRKAVTLLDVLSGASPDCAVVAQKAAEPERIRLFDAAFGKDYGLSLGILAQQHEARITTAEATALRAEARAQQAEATALRAEARAQQAEATAQQAEVKAQQAEAKARQAEADLNALSNSRFWPITAIPRWCRHQARLMRQHGFSSRLRALVKKIVRPLAKRGDAFLRSRPKLRFRCVDLTQRLGLYDPLRSLYCRCLGRQGIENSPSVGGQGAVSHLTVDSLTPRARQIYAHLNAAIKRRHKENR